MVPRLARIVLHALLIVAAATTAVVVPAQDEGNVLRAVAESGMAASMAGMPCGDEPPAATHEMPCDCCDPVTCDLSACLGTACLPELPRVAAGVATATSTARRQTPAPPSHQPDTPLRPPIA